MTRACPRIPVRYIASVKILLISGSTREASGNTATLRTVRALAPEGVSAVMYEGLAGLPAFNPDLDGADQAEDGLPAPVRDLRAQIASAGAILFCTPEYAGTLPGSLKNLLDWTVGGGEMDGKPVGWVNIAVGGRGGGAEEHLAMVLRYLGTRAVDGACVRLPVPREATAPDSGRPDGTIADAAIRDGLAAVLAALTR
jgi:chromate reductase, NAD(P)H dehydrogenase (quinone)